MAITIRTTVLDINKSKDINLEILDEFQGWVDKFGNWNPESKTGKLTVVLENGVIKEIDLQVEAEKPWNLMRPYDRVKIVKKSANFIFKERLKSQDIDIPWNLIEGGFLQEPEEPNVFDTERRCSECGQPLPLPSGKMKILKDGLLDKFAERLSVQCSLDGLKENQLRNFYDEVKRIEGRLKEFGLPKSKYDLEKRRLGILKARATEAKQRKNIPETFKKFIDDSVNLLTKSEADIEDFKAFVLVFEAVVGYFPKKEG
jgi:CRISPR type III-A-associated protein Csm2